MAVTIIVFAAPRVFLEQQRAPRKLPLGTNFFTVGFKNYYETFKQIRKLKQSLLYLAALILIGESIHTASRERVRDPGTGRPPADAARVLKQQASTLTYNLQYAVASYDLQTTLYMTVRFNVVASRAWALTPPLTSSCPTGSKASAPTSCTGSSKGSASLRRPCSLSLRPEVFAVVCPQFFHRHPLTAA